MEATTTTTTIICMEVITLCQDIAKIKRQPVFIAKTMIQQEILQAVLVD